MIMNKIFPTIKKELLSYFSSATAYIFLGSFLLISLFIFFWVETFFARNIVDVRPLFEWMPILLVFLVGALTMKSWSEERRMGTLEFLQTTPIDTSKLVLGKFLAAWILIGIGLDITLILPITISTFGNLDWGPVFGAYLGTFLLSGAYLSIGLFVSSRTDSQIVSLMLTVIITGVFYLIGSPALVHFFGYEMGEVFQSIGTGSRFESIARGVIDLGDIYYYVSIIIVFLSLNIFYLEKLRWDHRSKNLYYGKFKKFYALFIINILLVNFWIGNFSSLRIDLTKNQIYTLSEVSQNLVKKLDEPLFIRGFFSAKTHPLLSPLVPQIRDTLKEYEEIGNGNIRLEFIDPRDDEELETLANQKYGIKPIPFQFADRHQAELINSYFNIVIEYGDQFEVLGFKDLIEVKPRGDMDVDVKLRNLEYDITRSIKKSLYGFQSLDHLFLGLDSPLKFTGYISNRGLPKQLDEFKKTLGKVLDDYKKISGGKLAVEFYDPSGDPNMASEIYENYGFQPMATSLLSEGSFYFYMTISNPEQIAVIPLPQELDEGSLKRNFESAFKRLSPGFLKTVGLIVPKPEVPQNPYMPQKNPPRTYQLIEQKLSENYSVKQVDLEYGEIDGDIDLLLILAPKELSQKDLFIIDQFLMKGGTIMMSSSPFAVKMTPDGGIMAEKYESNMENWLNHHGIIQERQLVLDEGHGFFPITVMRNLGGFKVQQVELVNYPYAIDIREEGLNQKSPITSSIPQLAMYWASPIHIDLKKNENRKVTRLFKSSEKSWISNSLFIAPDLEDENLGFHQMGDLKSYDLATMVEGEFNSYFKGKTSPLVQEKNQSDHEEEVQEVFSGVIDKSSQAARIILFSSNEMLTDFVLRFSSVGGSTNYLNNLQVVENAVDWSLSDKELLSIRSRSSFASTIRPMDKKERAFWEYTNYILVVVLLGIVFLIYTQMKRYRFKYYKSMKWNTHD